MIDAVFISDLHLHPEQPLITERFHKLLAFAKANADSLYILGDFLNAWPGDDAMDAWSDELARHCRNAVKNGLTIYYMHGNRDFLLGAAFLKKAGMKYLPDPCVITLNDKKILLSHGDRYCTLDKAHQRFMKLTRNRWFKTLFLWLPLSLRVRIVSHVRDKSMKNNGKTMEEMDVSVEACIKDMQKHGVTELIHGHTHRPAHHIHPKENMDYHRFVLSDWDDTPQFLCYDKTKGVYFSH